MAEELSYQCVEGHDAFLDIPVIQMEKRTEWSFVFVPRGQNDTCQALMNAKLDLQSQLKLPHGHKTTDCIRWQYIPNQYLGECVSHNKATLEVIRKYDVKDYSLRVWTGKFYSEPVITLASNQRAHERAACHLFHIAMLKTPQCINGGNLGDIYDDSPTVDDAQRPSAKRHKSTEVGKKGNKKEDREEWPASQPVIQLSCCRPQAPAFAPPAGPPPPNVPTPWVRPRGYTNNIEAHHVLFLHCAKPPKQLSKLEQCWRHKETQRMNRESLESTMQRAIHAPGSLFTGGQSVHHWWNICFKDAKGPLLQLTAKTRPKWYDATVMAAVGVKTMMYAGISFEQPVYQVH
jgi:hypothetical protein